MSGEMIKKIVSYLESPLYSDRLKGTELLHSLVDPQDILAFHEYAEETNNYGLRLSLQRFLYLLLQKENETLCGLALSILFTYSSLPEKILKDESEKMLDEFMGTPNMFQYMKFLAIKKCWRALPTKERYMATRKIGSFQLVEVFSLLLDNFNSGDDKLIILTMEVFRRFGDKRANRFVRLILDRSDSVPLIIKALQVISELGYLFDQKYFKQYMKSADESIEGAAIEGLVKLKKDRALSNVKDFFKHSTTIEAKIRAVEILSKNPTQRSILSLLELWQEEEPGPVENKIESLVNEIEGQGKLNAILSFYPKANEVMELKIISLLNEIHHSKCYEFYTNVVKENKNALLTMAAMEAMAHYNDPRTVSLLTGFLKDPEDLLHYYALSAIVKHTDIDVMKLLTDTIRLKLDEERHHHQLILNVLKEQKFSTNLKPEVISYVLLKLRSSQRDNRYLAYSVVGKFYKDFNITDIFNIYHDEKNNLVIREAHRVFAEIASSNPDLLLGTMVGEDRKILTLETFLHHINLSQEVVSSLMLNNCDDSIFLLQKFHRADFWKFIYPFLLTNQLTFERLTWINVSHLTFEDFAEIWSFHTDSLNMRKYLLQSVSSFSDPRFGEFILSEYLTGKTPEMYPYVSRFVNGLV